jgi:hypothetical protein
LTRVIVQNKASKKIFFKNIFDSKIIEVWFNSINYALITSAFLYLTLNLHNAFGLFCFISYLFTMTTVTHGTRDSYNHLKYIYVESCKNWFVRSVLYSCVLFIRFQIILTPLQIIYFLKDTGRLPI